MNDCPNAEIRDRLPDFLHERLDARARGEVAAHVERCTDCRAELELLRELHVVIAAVPTVDVARIVGALPKSTGVMRARRPRLMVSSWRVAAAIAVLALGGVSLGTYFNIGSHAPGTLPVVDSQSLPLPNDVAAGAQKSGLALPTPVSATQVSELQTGDAMSDMSAKQLQTLLQDIESFRPLPPVEPDTTGGAVDTDEVEVL